MSVRYDEINFHNYEKIFENDDSIGKSLNHLALMLQYGDYASFQELEDIKQILNQAYLDYENLLKLLKPEENSHSRKIKNIYDQLIDKSRDNI